MVKLEEVEDEELDQAQPGPIEDSEDDGDYVDTGLSPIVQFPLDDHRSLLCAFSKRAAPANLLPFVTI